MTTDIAQRIQSRLEALGKNPSQVALEAGLGRSSVRDIILGRASSPRLDTLQKLTGPLECTLDYLVGESDDPAGIGIYKHLWWMDGELDTSPTKLETGVFRPLQRREEFEEPHDRTGPHGARVKLLDPRLPTWGVRLYEVADNSMEDIHILKGDVLTVANHPSGLRIPLTENMIVVVNQSVTSPKIEEWSVRQVKIKGGPPQLISRSNDTFEPITLRPSALEEESSILPNVYFTDASSISIEGIVVRITRQLPLSDAVNDFSYRDIDV